MSRLIYLTLLAAALVAISFGQDCNFRYYDHDSFVCVCDATACDFPGDVPFPTGTNYSRIVSSMSQYRFARFDGQEEATATGTTTIMVNHDVSSHRQSIFGFGGSFTDATALNLDLLTQARKDEFMSSYFGTQGIDYNLCRVPVAGSDFSVRAYSYDDVWMDVNLTNFDLAPEDYNYKIPMMQNALALNSEVLIFGSPWAPPAWMKTNEMHNGTGTLKPNMIDVYSDYLIMWIDAYESNQIPVWGLTPQNEPLTGFQNWPWNTCAFTADHMRNLIRDSLGPKLVQAGYGDRVLMVFDQNRDAVPGYPAVTLSDPDAAQYVSGTAMHWYEDQNFGPEVLDDLHDSFPDKFILYTEACEGWQGGDQSGPFLGSWDRAESYVSAIIENLNHWSGGWVDWNMALDMTGGPNWADNLVDAPIIINESADEFLKQPTYYAMGHFSKYIQRDAEVLETTITGNTQDIIAVAIHNPDGEEIVVVANLGDVDEAVSIEAHSNQYINFVLGANSIETVFYQG